MNITVNDIELVEFIASIVAWVMIGWVFCRACKWTIVVFGKIMFGHAVLNRGDACEIEEIYFDKVGEW